MSKQAWLESSLRRSSRLGLQVLERAQRRSVDWTRVCPSLQPAPVEDDSRNQPQSLEAENVRARTNLDDAFETIVEFMSQTTHQCKNFYKSVPVQGSSEYEVRHMCRYHSRQQPEPPKDTIPGRDEQQPLDDFHIEVSPGTYSVTARAGDSTQQTHLVRVDAGESVNLTFRL